MKKIISIVLCLAMIAALCACGLSVDSAQSTADTGVKDKTVTQTADENVPTPEPTEAPEEIRETLTKDNSPGKVIFYNNREYLEVILNELAQKYTAETGTKVEIITVLEGYDDAVSEAFDTAEAPTIFGTDKNNFAKWQISMLDLTGSKAAEQSVGGELNRYAGDELLGLAFNYDAFGLGVNVRLIEAAGFSLDSIYNWKSLRGVTEDIQQQYYNNNQFAAFAEPALSGDMWRYTEYLVNAAIYFECLENDITEQPAYVRADFLDCVRYFYELWYSNTPSSRWYLNNVPMSTPKTNFATGRVVFFPCSSWEFGELVDGYGLNPADYAMLPMYMGIRNEEEYTANCGNSAFWCVNREASDNDIEASLDFLAYITGSAGEALTGVCAMPFEGLENPNCFINSTNKQLASGLKPVDIVVDYLPGYDWECACFEWLIKYTTGYGDWVQYSDQFIIGWQDGYAAQHTY